MTQKTEENIYKAILLAMALFSIAATVASIITES